MSTFSIILLSIAILAISVVSYRICIYAKHQLSNINPNPIYTNPLTVNTNNMEFTEPCDFKMKSYIGCKIINAKPMSQNEFNKEYKDGPYENCEDAPGYLVVYPDGYKSWSPKRVFEESYRMVSDKEKELIIR